MKLIKLLFAIIISGGCILGGYYFIWNFMAKERHQEIKNKIEQSDKFKFSYTDSKLSGYPNNILIKFLDMKIKTENANSEIEYSIGDTLFSIYPFILHQQAAVSVPSNHSFIVKTADFEKKYKIKTSKTDLRFLEGNVFINLEDLKVFDVTSNALVFKADKLYYTSTLDNSENFSINITNLEFKNYKIDSILLDLSLSNITKSDIIAGLLNLMILEGDDFVKEFNKSIKLINKYNAAIKINSLKFVNEDSWYELVANLSLDKRLRLNGQIDLVSNNLETADLILKTLTNSNEINLKNIDIIKRLLSKDKNSVVRVSGKLEKGFLNIFNQRVSRTKPFKK